MRYARYANLPPNDLFDFVSISPLAGNGHDDSSAINDAIDACLNKHAQGNRSALALGPKVYHYKTPHATMTVPVGIVGCGMINSRVQLDSKFSGDAFSWSEVWFKTTIPTWASLGVTLSGFSIIGDLNSENVQNGLVFYDRTDCLLVRDVAIWYMPGRAFATGLTKFKTQAYLRESAIYGLRTHDCGNPGYPAVEFCTVGSGDATNSCHFYQIDVFGSRAEGLLIRNKNSVKNIGHLNFYGLRVEGTFSGTPLRPYDTMVIGDTGADYVGGIGPINFFGLSLLVPYTNQCALSIAATNATVANKIYELNFRGVNVGPGPGNGLNIQAGRSLEFEVYDNSVSGTKLTVGPATNGVGAPLVFRGVGNANGWSTSIHSTSAQSCQFENRNNFAATGNPGVGNDGVHGYGPGSLWLLPSTGVLWVCKSAATGAASWVTLANA